MSKTSLDKSKIRFLLLEGVHQNAIDTLNAAGYTNIEYITGALPEAELKEKIAEKACDCVKGKVYHRSDVGTEALVQKRVEHMKEILN